MGSNKKWIVIWYNNFVVQYVHKPICLFGAGTTRTTHNYADHHSKVEHGGTPKWRTEIVI